MQPSTAAQSRLHGRRLCCSVFGRGAAAHMRPCAPPAGGEPRRVNRGRDHLEQRGPPSRRKRPRTRGTRRVLPDTARRRRLDGCGGAAAARRGSRESTLAAALRLHNDFQAGGDIRSVIPLPRARRRALFVSLLLLPRFVGVHVRRHVPLPARCTATNTLTCRCLQIRRSAPCAGLTAGPTAGSARLSHGENCPLAVVPPARRLLLPSSRRC